MSLDRRPVSGTVPLKVGVFLAALLGALAGLSAAPAGGRALGSSAGHAHHQRAKHPRQHKAHHKRHHRKKHHRRRKGHGHGLGPPPPAPKKPPPPPTSPFWTIDPKSGALTLTGPGTVIDPGGLGPLRTPSALTASQILGEFGTPPTSRFQLIPSIRHDANGFITEINYEGTTETGAFSGTGVSFAFYSTPSDNLAAMWVSSPSYSTPQGIRVGFSSERQVQAEYPGITCEQDSLCGEGSVNSAGQLVGIEFSFSGDTAADGSPKVGLITVGDLRAAETQ